MKENLLAWISLAIVLSNLYIVSSSRLTYQIRGVVVQGLLLSILPLVLFSSDDNPVHMIILFVMGVTIKGIIIPRYLFKTIQDVRVEREVNPLIGYSFSMLYGVITAALSFYLISRIDILPDEFSPFHLSAAVATSFIGIYLIIARRNVVSQIIGYLVLENAGFTLGLSVAVTQLLFVEMGVLLDLVGGIFIMTMAVNHIYSEHKNLSVKSLERLIQ